MSTPLHPLWGRSIGHYSPSSDLNRCTLSVDLELAGLQAMEKISRLATETHKAAQTVTEMDIDIKTLESALHLASDPATIAHLANPPVISSCVRLMKTVGRQGRGDASPFSYEYGYLCFNLLVSSLNICLLERCNQLKEPLTMGSHYPGASAHVWTSIEVSYAVIDQFEVSKSGGDCDWILGWSNSITRRQQPLLLPQLEIVALFRMLWDDRKAFLRTLILFAPTIPGLSGLLFLFWRYITRIRASHSNPEGELLKGMLYDLALRYHLTADDYQREVVRAIIITNAPNFDGWSAAPKHVDAEDSRMIMNAFIKQTDNFSDSDLTEVIARNPSIIVQLVPLAIDSDCQDLLPDVVRCTIKYAWAGLIGVEAKADLEVFITIFFMALLWLLHPPHSQSYLPSPATLTRVMNAFRDGDLLDWVARAMVQLNPLNPRDESRFLQSMPIFFRNLAHVVPTSEMERCFGDYAPLWLKVFQHLGTVGYGMLADPSPAYHKHYSICIETWYQIAKLIGLENALYYENNTDCYNGRCSRAYTSDGVRFSCGGCTVAKYCDDRCQSVDWMYGHINSPHREWCSSRGKR